MTEQKILKMAKERGWCYISVFQKLSEEFIGKYNLQKPENSWLYATKEEKLNYIKKYTSYEVIDDEYIVAYKSVRNNDYSVFNF